MMREPLPSQRPGSRRMSLWHSILFLFTAFLFPVLAFGQAPNILIEPATVDFGSIGKGSSSTRTATVLNYNPMPATVTTGYLFSCGLTTGGGASCWGYNNVGQLGDGTITQRNAPAVVLDNATGSALTNATAIASGSDHTCALINDGKVKCWGSNANGELGNGTLTNSNKAVEVSGLTNATAIAVGDNYSCALINDGSMKCWGLNSNYQLGNGTAVQSTTPVSVLGISNAIAIATGNAHTCAITKDNGGIKCWGQNNLGQLGDGTVVQKSTPTPVSGLTNAIAISGGLYQTCAITVGGKAYCWGWNENGQLGDGSTTNRSTPAAVSGLDSGTTAIDTGRRHTCAVVNGGAKCWGFNAYNQLGDTTATQRLVPTDVSNLTTGVSDIDVESYYDASHSCATTSAGGVKCWGHNAYGQLGDASVVQRSAPVNTLASGALIAPTVDPLVLASSSALGISGTNATVFSITGGTCANATTLNANQACTVDMQFTDTVFGTKSASLDVASNDPDNNPASAPLLGEVSTAPGGVTSGLGLWLRADSGTSTTTEGADVSSWADKSPAKNDVSQAVATRQPNYVSNAFNFNPALDFAGGQVLSNLTGSKTLTADTDPVTMLAVSTNKTSGDWRGLINFSGPTNYPFLAWYYNKPNLYIDGTGSVHNLFDTDVDATTIPVAMHARTNNANPQNSRLGYNGLANQKSFTSATGKFPASTINNLLTIGAETDAAGYPLNGLYPEAVVYNRDLSDAEMIRVNSYLGIKYGLTMSENYLAADGTTKVWDKAANSTYHNNVAGIGRDDASALNQKQSKSVNAGFQPTLGLGTIAASNAANSSTFAADKTFLMWGSDTATYTHQL